MSTPTKKPRRRGRIAALLLVILAGLLAFLARHCGVGLGGSGLSGLLGEVGVVEPAAPVDAALPMDSMESPRSCALYLSSEGLTLNGKPVPMAEAVRICTQVGRASLRATGGAEAGAYDELVRALEAASVPVEIERDRARAPR